MLPLLIIIDVIFLLPKVFESLSDGLSNISRT